MLVFVVVVAAAGLLTAGLLAGQVALVWAALGLSLAGAALFAFVLLRGRGRRVESGVDGVEARAAGEPTGAEAAVLDDPAAEDEPAPVAEPAVVGEAAADEPAALAEPAAAESGEPAEPAAGVPAELAAGGPNVPADAAAEEPAEPAPPAEAPTEPPAQAQTPEAVEATASSATAADSPGELLVRVIPGRRRFHVADCRLLTGHDAEQISLDEARDEGFTACTACIPKRESLTPVG